MLNKDTLNIHQTACIDLPCEIGEGTNVWHFSHIMKNSKIGKNCNIGQNVVISSDVTIGSGVKIQNNVSVYSGVTVEDDSFLGPSCVFTNVINPRSFIIRKNEYRPTKISKGASIGANATVLCGITIGRYALVGAGAVVTKSVPNYALVTGNPAKVTGYVCKCANKLSFEGKHAKCIFCGDSYLIDEKDEVKSSND